MVRRIVLTISVFLLVVLTGCKAALPASVRVEVATPQPTATGTSAPKTPQPTATPLPTATPMPTVDAQWYRERDDQLRQMIHNYRPTATEQEIDQSIARMAIDPNKPMVALTFDDGPKPGITDKILDVLEQYNARATFFVLGWRLGREENKDILRRATALGCEIGNHTWSHKMLSAESYVGVRYEVKNTNKIIFDITGVNPHCLRPPGGQNSYEAMRVARENDMVVVLWSQSGNVYEVDPKRIAQNVEKQIVDGNVLEDGDIVLLHDTHLNMVDAVKIIVPKLLDEGYQLVTVWELLNCAPQPPVPGNTYKYQAGPIKYR